MPVCARRPRLKLFWQLLIAFVITASVIAVGIYISGLVTIRRVETELSENPPPLVALWVSRIGAHYAQMGGWSGIGPMIESYPLGDAWGPWGSAWDLPVTVADAQGVVVYSSRRGREGGVITAYERSWAVPVELQGDTVGFLSIAWLAPAPADPGAINTVPGLVPRPRLEVLQRALRRLLVTEVAVVLVGLVVGATLSRRISRPVTQVAEAAGQIAAGDLSVRVPETGAGELADLAQSFNRMASELERSDELRRNLTADVAHDLRTPLSVIRGKLEGILDGVYPATEAHLLPILEETQVLTHLVEDLRLLALAEARQLPLDLRPIDIGGLIRDTQVNFGPLAQDRGISIVLDLPGILPWVMADRQRIAQVMGNLITNALRHTPSGGIVTLTAAIGDTYVAITVRDTGTGIPLEELPYVFERFWRGEKSRSRETGGSGLGLAIARELVMLHGGVITVESSPGEGASFRFTLPLAEPGLSTS